MTGSKGEPFSRLIEASNRADRPTAQAYLMGRGILGTVLGLYGSPMVRVQGCGATTPTTADDGHQPVMTGGKGEPFSRLIEASNRADRPTAQAYLMGRGILGTVLGLFGSSVVRVQGCGATTSTTADAGHQPVPPSS